MLICDSMMHFREKSSGTQINIEWESMLIWDSKMYFIEKSSKTQISTR